MDRTSRFHFDCSNIRKLCRSTSPLAVAGISGQSLLFPPPNHNLTACHVVLPSKPYLIWGGGWKLGIRVSGKSNLHFLTAGTSGKIRPSKNSRTRLLWLFDGSHDKKKEKKQPSVLSIGGKRRFKIPTLAFIGVMSHPSPHRREYRWGWGRPRSSPVNNSLFCFAGNGGATLLEGAKAPLGRGLLAWSRRDSSHKGGQIESPLLHILALRGKERKWVNSSRVRCVATRRAADPQSHMVKGRMPDDLLVMFSQATCSLLQLLWCADELHDVLKPKRKKQKRKKTSSGLTCHTWLDTCSHWSQNRQNPPLHRRPEPVDSAVNQRQRLPPGFWKTWKFLAAIQSATALIHARHLTDCPDCKSFNWRP